MKMIRDLLGTGGSEPPVQEIHRVAAAWWASWITEEEVKHKTGDVMGEALSSWARERIHGDGYDGDTAEQFQEHLAELITEKDHRGLESTWMRVDYHPDPILKEACEEVDIRPGMTLFPQKTSMWLEDGKIFVKVGHASTGAERKQIWPESDPEGDEDAN